MRRSDRLDAVIVGAGLMGRWHADAAARTGAKVVAVVDPDPARAGSLAARYSKCMAETRLDAALVNRRGHVVHLCTPSATHESLVSEAVEAGCHVLAEKPLAPTLAITRRLLDAADARGVLLCPVHQFLFQPGVMAAADRLSAIGAVRHFDFITCSAGADGRPETARDQIAVEILPHPFSLFARLMPSEFGDASWDVAHAAPGELRLWAWTRGMTASIAVSMSGRPTQNTLRIVAEQASIECDLFHGFATFEQGTPSRGTKVLRPFLGGATRLLTATSNLARRALAGEYAYPGLRELVRRFYLAAADGGTGPISRAETLGVAGACDRAVAALGPKEEHIRH